MNNKGFTLIELLATIVLISILGGIATVSVISVINTSKNKSEKIFVDKIGNAIESYLSLNSSSFTKKNDGLSGNFNKSTGRKNEDGSDATRSVGFREYEGKSLKILNDENFISTDGFINPKNKKTCFNDSNYPNIRVFRDGDYVTYYYVSLKNNNCDINEENLIITNIPKSLCDVLEGYNDPDDSNEKNITCKRESDNNEE